MADRFDKFTEHARKVLAFAQEEAHRFNHNYIGTEHILLGPPICCSSCWRMATVP